jgi:hypothetical protein
MAIVVTFWPIGTCHLCGLFLLIPCDLYRAWPLLAIIFGQLFATNEYQP